MTAATGVRALASAVLQAAKQGPDAWDAVLQLPASATREEARAAFKRLRIALHPDKVHEPSLEILAAQAFQAVGQAWEQLQREWERRGSHRPQSQPEQQPAAINRWSAFTAGQAPAWQQAVPAAAPTAAAAAEQQQQQQQQRKPWSPELPAATLWSKQQPVAQLLKAQAAAAPALVPARRNTSEPNARSSALDASHASQSDTGTDSELEAGDRRRRSAPSLYAAFGAAPQASQPRRSLAQLAAKAASPAPCGSQQQHLGGGTDGGGGGKWAARAPGGLLRHPLKQLPQGAGAQQPRGRAARQSADARDLHSSDGEGGGGGSSSRTSGGSNSSSGGEDDSRPASECRQESREGSDCGGDQAAEPRQAVDQLRVAAERQRGLGLQQAQQAAAAALRRGRARAIQGKGKARRGGAKRGGAAGGGDKKRPLKLVSSRRIMKAAA